LLLLLLYKQSRVLHVVSIYSQDKKIKQSHEEKICVEMLAGFKKSKFGFCCCNIWFVLCGVECSRDGSVVVFLAGLELLAQRRLCLGGLLLLFLAARDGELEDVRELFVLGGLLRLDVRLQLVHTSDLSGTVGEDANGELELSHKLAVFVSGGLPSFAQAISDSLGNADSYALLVLFSGAHFSDVEGQHGVFFVHVSQEMASVCGLEGIRLLDVTLQDGELALLLVVEVDRLAFAGGHHDVNGENLIVVKLEIILCMELKGVGVDVLHQDGSVGIDDVLLHLARLGTDDGLYLVVLANHLESLSDRLALFFWLDHAHSCLRALPCGMNHISTLVGDGLVRGGHADCVGGLGDVAIKMATKIDGHDVAGLDLRMDTGLRHRGIMSDHLVDANAGGHGDATLDGFLLLLAFNLFAVFVQLLAFIVHVFVDLGADCADIATNYAPLEGQFQRSIADFSGLHVLLDDGLVGQVVQEVFAIFARGVTHD